MSSHDLCMFMRSESGIFRYFHSIGLILVSRDDKFVLYGFHLSFPDLLLGISSFFKLLTQIVTSFTTVFRIRFGYKPCLRLGKRYNNPITTLERP